MKSTTKTKAKTISTNEMISWYKNMTAKSTQIIPTSSFECHTTNKNVILSTVKTTTITKTTTLAKITTLKLKYSIKINYLKPKL